MEIRFRNAIILTKDIAASKSFYNGLLGIAIMHDSDTFVLLEGNLGLHRADVFWGYIEKQYKDELMGRDNLDLYFTVDSLEEAEQRLRSAGVTFIHGIRKCDWGESVFRVLDPDGHIVEIGDAR